MVRVSREAEARWERVHQNSVLMEMFQLDRGGGDRTPAGKNAQNRVVIHAGGQITPISNWGLEALSTLTTWHCH